MKTNNKTIAGKMDEILKKNKELEQMIEDQYSLSSKEWLMKWVLKKINYQMQRIYREVKKEGTLIEIPYDTDSIKDVCARCGKKLREEEAHKRIIRYEARGNFCEDCNAKSNKLSIWNIKYE